MTLFALTKMQEAGGTIALAAVLGLAGVFLLLPRPRGRFVAGGIAALIGAAAVFAAWLYRTFGDPMPDVVGSVLFWLFSAGALGFGATLVVQKNPARGAIAFAFVILSTCGLFLLLAAPFLMAATIIIYAGAIIVTFLFLLMLSYTEGPSDENNRSREPLYGAFAGFAFVGLVLFALFQTSQADAAAEPGAAKAESRLLLPVLTAEEKQKLAEVVAKLDGVDEQLGGDLSTNVERTKRIDYLEGVKNEVAAVVGYSRREATGNLTSGTLPTRLEKAPGKPGVAADLYREDQQAREVLKQAEAVREANFTTAELETHLMTDKPDVAAVKAQARKLREHVVILKGAGQLPARNVANLGFLLYSEHLLAIELAGTLLLVATIGAVAIAHRKPRREWAQGEPAGGSPSRTEAAA